LLLLVLAGVLPAQRKRVQSGPRATALVVLSPDGQTAPRLIPICIRDNDQFWDASVYQATPRPMALEPGTVYEVERTGKSLGFFTVQRASQQGGRWTASGRWEPRTRSAAAASPEDDERPVLRRAPPAEKPSQPQAQPAPPRTSDEDADRPPLKRGKPSGEEPEPEPQATAPVTPSAQQLVPAISDASGPDPRPYTVDLNADAQARLRDLGSSLAQQAALKHAAAPPGTRVELKNPAFHYFDLDVTNTPQVVISAVATLIPPGARGRKPAPPSDYLVTLVARENVSGDVNPVYTRVIPARHAELDGKLELLDAVDVDGDGRGELLFRRFIGRDVSYLVVKVGLSQATILYDSGH